MTKPVNQTMIELTSVARQQRAILITWEQSMNRKSVSHDNQAQYQHRGQLRQGSGNN